MPMGATIISDRLIMRSAAMKTEISCSQTATPIPATGFAAAAVKNLILDRENLLDHVREVSPHFQERLQALGEKYSIIGDARGMGFAV